MKRWSITLLACLALAALTACRDGGPHMAAGTDGAGPDAARIESVAMAASQQGNAEAEQRLRSWAARGMPVAQRELGILYRARPGQQEEAMRLLEQAARSGDAQAAFHLAEAYRGIANGTHPAGARGAAGAASTAPPAGADGIRAASAASTAGASAPAAAISNGSSPGALAWRWYLAAAEKKHAKAALMLGLLARNGEGVPRDAARSARWLEAASELGNAHAMFLLSYAYREGQGVPRDAARAQHWLEESAEHEYPPALQELAMAVADSDAERAGHLLKEAHEHRRNNWNRF
ncbi:tetratricopeptide repeat protein [Massilia sp. YIM B04103]|uniref:tetratricopeptide repeat protein n=1 Tax=Massilia sp. YIM B04103 TaxID=2963106 RepID=UPI00210E7A42|nr:sel1 repeat family protein [Massilia sp. YIM B04103]